MKEVIFRLILVAGVLAKVLPAQARDTKYLLPIKAALAVKDAEEKLDGSVKFYFGNQETPKILTKLGTDMTNRKTNAVGKSDEKACNWVFLSAMIQLEKRAKQLGANAVVNIVSYYHEKYHVESDRIRMSRRGIMAGVAFRGEFVKIAD